MMKDTMTREEIWYAVTSCKGITRQEIERILDVVGDPSALFGTNRESALDLLTERSEAEAQLALKHNVTIEFVE